MNRELHIISHDIPWPANYGGVIDIFYTIRALHAKGVRIHLHCFTSGHTDTPELEKYCQTVTYYPRRNHLESFSFRTPLIVNSRTNAALLANLLQDDHPVLLEGIHCTHYLNQDMLPGRKVLVRLFNTEFEYYNRLARSETNLFKRLYFQHESRLLKKYEQDLSGKAVFLALSKQDVVHYRQEFKTTDIHFLAPFLPYSKTGGEAGKGSFCLYHGNLSVNENERAATWLLEHVFNTVEIPFVIAGKNPSKKLQRLAHTHQHTCLVADPSDQELRDMIIKAQVHVLPSFNNTGIKLKLLNAFFNGRHCLVNAAGVAGSGLEAYCQTAETAVQFQEKICDLFAQPFLEEEKEKRQELLQTLYNNNINAEKLMQFLW